MPEPGAGDAVGKRETLENMMYACARLSVRDAATKTANFLSQGCFNLY